jgi:RNA polymerase sigma factor (sigma-70 family)
VTREARTAADFDEVFWPLFLLAFKAAYKLLRDRAAAEDVAAEALGRLHARWAKLAHADYCEAWVLRVATNLALDVVRRGAPPRVGQRAVVFEDDIAAQITVHDAVRRLSRRQQEAIALHFLVGLREHEVAEVLGIGAGSVRRHLARGLQRLRVDLGAARGDEESA